MPEYCTCGAQLPPDALFCHRCGKPQRDLVEPEEPHEEPPPLPVAVPVAPAQRAINFHNRAALRAAMMSAGITAFAMIPIRLLLPPTAAVFLTLMWPIAAGFFGVWLYQRQTGEALSGGRGARIGWITGLFCFLIILILSVVALVTVLQEGSLAAAYRKSAEMQGMDQPEIEEVSKMLEEPSGAAAIVGVGLVFMFLMFTGLPTLGGALGAKVLDKE